MWVIKARFAHLKYDGASVSNKMTHHQFFTLVDLDASRKIINKSLGLACSNSGSLVKNVMNAIEIQSYNF